MEKLSKIVAFAILPILLISIFPNTAFGHQLNPSDCTDIGLVLDPSGTIGGICVNSLETVCVTTLHGDHIGGGFTNIGTDQFGNDCREVHTDDSDLPPSFPLPKSFLEELLPFMLIGLLVIAGIIVGIIFVIKKLRK